MAARDHSLRRFFHTVEKVFLSLLSLTLASPTFGSSDRMASGSSNYYFEFLTFKDSDRTKTFVEVFCQVPAAAPGKATNASTESGHEISITMFNRETWHADVLNYVDSVQVHDIIAGEALAPQLIRFTFAIPPGDYVATVKVRNRAALSTFNFDHEIDVPDYHYDELQISDLQVSTSITQSNEQSVLVKNNRMIQPNVSHIFGPGQKVVFIYNEVYNLAYSRGRVGQFEATYSIVDKQGNRLKTLPYKIDKPGASSAISVAMPIEDLPSGQYQVVLDIEDLDNQQVASNAANLIILRPEVNLANNSLSEAVRKLRKPVIKNTDKEPARAELDDRQTGTQRWQKGESIEVDYDVHAGNDLVYTKRRAYANQHFVNANGEGWETDQGKIYLMNGPPTNVNRVTATSGNETYEIWEYSNLDRKYLFVDEWGKGHFRLVTNDNSNNQRIVRKPQK